MFDCMNFLYIMHSHIRYIICKYLSYYVDSLFLLCTVFFAVQKHFGWKLPVYVCVRFPCLKRKIQDEFCQDRCKRVYFLGLLLGVY